MVSSQKESVGLLANFHWRVLVNRGQKEATAHAHTCKDSDA
jgi:hypothetical protein